MIDADRLYLGIDPGLGGGMAVLTAGGYPRLVAKIPATEQDILTILRDVATLPIVAGVADPISEIGASSSPGGHVRAILEKVASSPQMGVVSAFTFGKGYGGLRMALAACQIPFDEVAPGVWQRAMQCLTKGDKNVSKRRAQELFPSVKVTHAVADALLLAEFGRRRALAEFRI